MRLVITSTIIIMVAILVGFILGYSKGQYDTYKKQTDETTLMDIYFN